MTYTNPVIRKLMATMPDRVRHTCTPIEIMARVYAIEPGWRCPGCARPYMVEDYGRPDAAGRPAHGVCPGCRMPLPRRCTTSGCGGVVPPEGQRHYRTGRMTYYHPGPYCEPCIADADARARSERLGRSDIPKVTMTGACAWQTNTSWRRAIGTYAQAWSVGQFGVSALYIHGPCGTGKSVAAAYMLRRLHQGTGKDFLWTTERAILDAHRDRYDDGREPWRKAKVEKAVDLLLAVKHTPAVVIDEMWSGGCSGYTDRQIELVFDVLAHRFQDGLPTILCSNTPFRPDPNDRTKTVFVCALGHGADRQRGDALTSRFEAVGDELEANGMDRRRAR